MPDRTGLFLRLPGAVWLPQTAGVAADPDMPIVGVAGREGQRLALFYVYLTVSYPGLDSLVASPGPRWGGRHIFFPVLRPLQRAGLLDITLPSPIPDSTLVSPPPAQGLLPLHYNQYSFLYYPFQDFGTAGALGYALVIGLLVGAIYASGRRNRQDPLRLLVVAQTATAVALTPFVNKFNNTAWWYILVLTTLPWVVARLRTWRAGRTG
jgi:oligosaccharide repeat unit polymerase